MIITTMKTHVLAKHTNMVTGEEVTYEWTHEEARKIALAEIFEHAGGASSAAYQITAALFAHYEKQEDK